MTTSPRMLSYSLCSLYYYRYVLVHHVMGEIEGIKGGWGYVEGGMGAVSGSIANAARSHGATILTEKVGQFELC